MMATRLCQRPQMGREHSNMVTPSHWCAPMQSVRRRYARRVASCVHQAAAATSQHVWLAGSAWAAACMPDSTGEEGSRSAYQRYVAAWRKVARPSSRHNEAASHHHTHELTTLPPQAADGRMAARRRVAVQGHLHASSS